MVNKQTTFDFENHDLQNKNLASDTSLNDANHQDQAPSMHTKETSSDLDEVSPFDKANLDDISNIESLEVPTNNIIQIPLNKALIEQGQIRLTQLSVYNWGSFHGLHTASIDKAGTLITGDNGAGKSTLIDGLMALLLPAGKATFNVAAAQGDKSDRSLLSYMRGSFGSAHDGAQTRVKSKREKGVVTGLSALYQADDGRYITLCALFWITGASNSLSEVKRLYCVAKRHLALNELLEIFEEGNTRKLKQFLKDDPLITDCDSHFSDYQALYRKVLHMDNKNAPALLSRALGLKKIDDLTKLIRELVLEPSTVREDASKVVEEFTDLIATHDKLMDAKEQSNYLARLPGLADSMSKYATQLALLLDEKIALPIYIAKILQSAWQEKLDELAAEIIEIERKIQGTETDEKDTSDLVERRHEAYISKGGGKIEIIKKEIEHLKSKLSDIISTASIYQIACQLLSVDETLEEGIFINNQSLIEQKLEQLNEELEITQNAFVVIRSAKIQGVDRIKEINEEAQAIISRPDSNIDIKYQKLRDEMVEALDIDSDKFRFIGELIDVDENERAWQGAIERALGGLKTTLLVPDQDYALVTKWLNARQTGLHVRVQVVKTSQKVNVPTFSATGFLSKLTWKGHLYQAWLKQFLEKFDLQCVPSVEMLNETPHSMTISGLVQHEKGRFEKKDQRAIDDKRAWCLGFSNKSRLLLLDNERKEMLSKLSSLEKEDTIAYEAKQAVEHKLASAKAILNYKWDQINAPYWHERINQMETELSRLVSSSGDIEQAKNDWESAKEALKEIQQLKSNLMMQLGAKKNDKKNAQLQFDKVDLLAQQPLDEMMTKTLQKRVGVITIETAHKESEIDKQLELEIEKVRKAKTQVEYSANSIMSGFRGKDKWVHLTVDWGAGADGLNDFVNYFIELEKEGLPSLVEQFKERLNKHATQSLAGVKTKLEAEREEILDRIDIINRVLRKTEFKQGSYLKLGSKREKFPHVIEFDKKLKNALSQITSDDHEMRFKLLSDVIDILDKASRTTTSNTLESLRLLDPRYQMSFYAEEIDAKTGDIRDVLSSSSGKSGGEKESFAGTIVAASLAYVLTPDGFDKPVYATVFLDEAFSNTAETVSRRVLKVFNALNIHVNLITPFKNLNLARESARSLLITERDAVMHESSLCEVTWEEMDVIMENKQKQEAATFGIDVID